MLIVRSSALCSSIFVEHLARRVQKIRIKRPNNCIYHSHFPQWKRRLCHNPFTFGCFPIQAPELCFFWCFPRNWYVDEPSCGGEVCVVLYHQPSAPPGVGGPYMFQWNDDRCNMKNNFICKYSLGNNGEFIIINNKLIMLLLLNYYFKRFQPQSPGRRDEEGSGCWDRESFQFMQQMREKKNPSVCCLQLLVGYRNLNSLGGFVKGLGSHLGGGR